MDETGSGTGSGGSVLWPPAVPAAPLNPLRRPFSRLAILAIKAYQATLSRFWPNACMYSPSCSNYAIHAITERGLAVGVLLGTWRILRCHPFAKGGYDPPPGYETALRRADDEDKRRDCGKKAGRAGGECGTHSPPPVPR